MSSLAETAERQIFKQLSEFVEAESKRSVYAIGGTIPITSPSPHPICKSDETVLKNDELSSPSATETNTLGEGIDLTKDDSKTCTTEAVKDLSAIHNLRCDPVIIRWDSSANPNASYKVTFPCNDAEQPNFEQLLKDCQPATFGKGGKDVLDESYRKAGKLDETAFCSNFNPYALGIVDTAGQILAPTNCRQTSGTHGVRAELYKLNVYSSPSGKFKAHVDTPRSKHQIGSLVVCLPSVHEGGQLVLRHQGRETVFDWSGDKGKNAIQWAAFYSDCEHEVLEVTAGHRLTLTYNLYATCWANNAFVDSEALELYQTLKSLLSEPGFCKNGKIIGYNCAHAYPHSADDASSMLPATLKGVDKIVYECFLATKLEVVLRPCIDFELEEFREYEEENIRYAWYTDKWGPIEDWEDRDPNTTLPDESHYFLKQRQNLLKRFALFKQLDKESKGNDGLKVVALGSRLIPLQITDMGLDEGASEAELAREWDENISIKAVKWLNAGGHRQAALVHGAYGNQAEIDIKYSRLVITLEIPPFNDRRV